MSYIHLITGGERSGKSTYAESEALRLSRQPVYLATARIWDEEFRQRILRHQERRGPEWTNIEEDIRPSKHDFTGRVVLIDCITLWATNYFFDMQQDVDQALEALKKEFDTLVQQDATFIFVTNELGMGGMSESRTQRLFTQLQGWMNQHVAARADRVTLMVSGLPLTVKG
ncbi:adenosylcobinamide kinase/adenosylcobinamidephosphate guanylyltransferase [Porphyromonas sp. oral taxon 279 str. F0450]|uniref:bifunctional adenosylcobinamide kinase/adenosylcobinamide-phosphate guanylyltransferase n=1 Tax=Porphyromonas sp. oral taxon 279 TaxID=712438 RepID=UPI00027C589B|nr:bifunctional adenosylcobinamide kinase/adenosylcobinamide-phosphate guanylyltransferase [Porphyromonas sp. oral taxon 279]EJU15786.1 adenosylcobinamide kinase/adenosylcobinamidephosphate guanylyltransferase [Porphyromonas sp. oral taxon 279 str. F0450]